MTKKELIYGITKRLEDEGVRKPIKVRKTVLHITDDEGHKSNFTIQKKDTNILFTNTDVAAFLDAMVAVVEDALKEGDDVNVQGFGRFSVKRRAPTTVRHPETGEPVFLPAHYTPKFEAGKNLRLAAKVYEMISEDRQNDVPVCNEEDVMEDVAD